MTDKKTITIIEDNHANASLLVDMIHYLSYKCILFENGEDAIHFLTKTMTDMVLLDLSLPGMSGFDVFNELQKNVSLKTIPIIAVTAMAMPDQIEKINQSGFTGYIGKPIQFTHLQRVIETCLIINHKEKMIV